MTITRVVTTGNELRAALTAIGVAAGEHSTHSAGEFDEPVGRIREPEALLAAIRSNIAVGVGVEVLEPGSAWPRNRPALVIRPNGRSVVAVASTGCKRSRVIASDGRRRRVATRDLRAGTAVVSADSKRVGRVFTTLRDGSDPRHASMVVTFPTMTLITGSKVRLGAALSGFMAFSLVATVALFASWALAFAAVEATANRGAGLIAALVAALVAAVARGGATNLAARVATAWNLRMRDRLARNLLDADPRRTRAAGGLQLLVGLSEAENVDSATIEAALMASVGLASMMLALLLALATFPWVLAPSLACWLTAALLVARRYRNANDRLVEARRMTGSWVAEQLRAHETRWVQDPGADLSDHARELANRYDDTSRRVDRADWLLSFAIPSGGLAAIMGAVGILAVAGDPDAAVVAAAVAAALIAYQAVSAVSTGLAAAARVVSARRAALAILADEGESENSAVGSPIAADDPRYTGAQAREIAALITNSQARVVLTGPTGSGKTRLVTTLARLTQDVGPVPATAAKPVRVRPVLAPSFGDNFMFRGTLAYNLLIGRGWPASEAERAQAEEVALAVGLGEVIERMPIGIETPVGETGWQLSNGERTMVFLARALIAADGAVLLDDELDAIDARRRLQVMKALCAHSGALLRTATLDATEVQRELASESEA